MKKKARKKVTKRKPPTCRCCELLKSEVAFLRSILRPKAEHFDPLPIVTFEADQIISGADHKTEFTTPEQDKRQAEIDSEAARILSGQY